MVMAREALYQYNGNYYGIEVALCPVTMAYRKDLFDKYNIKVPTTWAEFLDAARKFKPYGISIAATPDMRAGLGDDINILLRAANADIVDPKNNLRITPAYKTLVGDYRMMQQQGLSYMFQSDEERWTGIRDNKVATYFMADWAAGWLRDNVPEQANMWTMAALPKFDAQSSPTSANGGTGLHMMKYTKKDKEVLWDMIKYLHIDPAMNVEKFKQVSLFPPVYDAMDRCSGPVAYYNNQDLGALYKSLSTQMPTQYQAGWRSVWGDAINANVYDYYEGTITIDQLVKFGEDAVKNY
jgi:arabinosaccharide transport system substrate-binding protein